MAEIAVRILFIEDNPDDTAYIQEMLREGHDEVFDVDCVENLSAGLDRLAKGLFDIVLLDLSLPDSHGLATFDKVNAFSPTVPIVVLSGLADETVAMQAVQKGAQDYLVKGQITGLLLSRAIRYAVERKRHAETLRIYRDRLRALAFELSRTEERERGRLAANFHDTVVQTLSLVNLRLEQFRAETPTARSSAWLKEAQKLLEQAINQSRLLLFDLSPPPLHELGLEAALEWLAEKVQAEHGLAVTFEGDGRPKPLPAEAREILYRTSRELLQNVIKHAHAKNVRVSSRASGGCVVVEVADDGVGFDPENAQWQKNSLAGFGLFYVRERLDYLGGNLEVSSRPGTGTRVTLTVPLSKAPNADFGEPL